MDNRWYITRKNNTENSNDETDGNISEVLFQLDSALISTVVLLVSNHIKMHLRKHLKMNTSNMSKKLFTKKINKNSKNGTKKN